MFIRFAWNNIYVVKLTETNKSERFTLRWVFIVQSHVHLPVRGLQRVSTSIAGQLQGASVVVHRGIHLCKIGVSRCTTTDVPWSWPAIEVETRWSLLTSRCTCGWTINTHRALNTLCTVFWDNTMQSGMTNVPSTVKKGPACPTENPD